MPRVTLSIPSEVKNMLDKHPEINWPEVFRYAIRDRVEQLLKLEQKGVL